MVQRTQVKCNSANDANKKEIVFVQQASAKCDCGFDKLDLIRHRVVGNRYKKKKNVLKSTDNINVLDKDINRTTVTFIAN